MLAGREKVTRPAKHNMDYVLLTVVIFLVCFGLLMIYSASSYEAGLDFGDSAYYLKKQAFATLLGFGGMIFVANFPYKMWQRFDWLAILIAIVLLLLLKTPLGVTKNGATRWLNLGIGMTIQPAEVAKIAVIVYVASMIQRLEKINTNIIRTPKGIAIVMGPTLLIAGMIYIISKNMSSAIIVVGIAVVMIFVSVPDYKLFVIIGILGIVAVVGVVILATQGGAGTSFRLSRVQVTLNSLPIVMAMKPSATSEMMEKLFKFSAETKPIPSMPSAPRQYGPMRIPATRYAVTAGRLNIFVILERTSPASIAIESARRICMMNSLLY